MIIIILYKEGNMTWWIRAQSLELDLSSISHSHIVTYKCAWWRLVVVAVHNTDTNAVEYV